MSKEKIKATIWAILVTAILARLIALGSGNLKHFDAALVGYAFATLFAVFGITRRYALWLQRPPTAMYWTRGWTVLFRFLHPRHVGVNLFRSIQRLLDSALTSATRQLPAGFDLSLTRMPFAGSPTRFSAFNPPMALSRSPL